MVCVWVAGKAVWSPYYTWAMSNLYHYCPALQLVVC